MELYSPDRPGDPKFEDKIPSETNSPVDPLASDADYARLLELFQQGKLERCQSLLTELKTRYQDDPRLLKFQQDLSDKISMISVVNSSNKAEARQVRKKSARLAIFAILGTILVVSAFLVSYYYRNINLVQQQQAAQNAQLDSLANQAAQLLLSGQPQPALEIVNKIKSIDPDYQYLPVLTCRTDDLLRLEAKYNQALDLVSQNNSVQALALLKEIDAEEPGFWDVSQKIKDLESSVASGQYLQVGNQAYLIGNWDQVIISYESALAIDPNISDPVMREQLVKSYLNKIIGMLQNEGTSSDMIGKAQEYYQKAVAMIAQDKSFAAEREELQKISGDLLQLKYTQSAKTNLEDKNQTVISVSEAVNYLKNALQITPENTTLQSDLQKAQLYLTAFQNFIQMNWVPAITNLTQIVSMDEGFAGGNARALLYESWSALGKQYYSAGVYADARINFEQAEIIAWKTPENILRMFQVQVNLGDSIGMMGDYKNANSYYQYALDSAKILTKLNNFPSISTQLSEASNLVAANDEHSAYNKYKEAMTQIYLVFTTSQVTINSGACLALFADANLSTVDAIQNANVIPQDMVIPYSLELTVPSIQN